MLAFLLLFTSFFQVPQPSTPVDSAVYAPIPGSLKVKTLTVNRIIILGNKVTRDRIILRELSLKPDDTVSSNRIDDILVRDRAKIYNLRLFNTVVVRWLPYDLDRVDIIIELKERWYLFPQPILELADRNFNEWYQNFDHDWKRINYGMRLYQTNFRGQNEKLRLIAQFGYVRRFGLNYSIPNMGLSQKHGLIFNFSYDEPRNVAYATEDHNLTYLESNTIQKKQFGSAVSYTYRKSFYETHALSLEYQDSRISDSIPKLNPNYYKDGSMHQWWSAISYTFNSEHRDVIAYPMKGYQFTFHASKTGLGFGQDVNMWEVNATYAKHMDIGGGFNLANFSAGYASTPTSQPYALYGALGYRRQFLRGYEVHVIEGPQFFLNKTTLKRKIFSRAWTIDEMPLEQFSYIPVALYLKAYVDFGYVRNYPRYEQLGMNTRLSNRMLMGAGMGLDLVTLYDNVFRFEYTITREGVHGFFFHVKKEF